MESFFKKIQEYGVKYLFIDVSQNGGGNDNTHEYIYKYINSNSYIRKSVHYFTPLTAEEKYNEVLRQQIMQNTEYKGKTAEEIQDILKNNKDFIELKELCRKGIYKDEYLVEGNNSGFEGEVFIIMGWYTYSAAADFCEEAKRRKLGMLVGEKSMQRFPYPGNVRYDKLPNSLITFCYPATFYIVEPDITNSEGFLQPDIHYPMDHIFTVKDYKKIIDISKKTVKSKL